MPKKILKGKVVSDKMEQTVVVAVDMPYRHPTYGKMIKNTRRFKAHDDIGVKIDDLVIIEESRPYAKTVNWLVREVINK